MPADLTTVVQRMIDAGEPEEAIAEVIRAYPKQQSGGLALSPITAAGVGAAKLAPTATGIVSAGAKAVGKLDPVLTSIIGGSVPGVGAAVGAAVPKVAGGVAKLTAPSQAINTGSAFLKATTKAGPLMRGAGWLSRAAGTAGVPLTILSLLLDAKNQTDALATDPSMDEAMKAQLRLRLARPFEQ